MEVYRVTKDSPEWLFKVYDYARTDAFCFGQGIPVNFEYGHDEPIDDTYQAVVLVDEGKPVAGCKITYPGKNVARIARVCVTREYQHKGAGSILIKEAEKWILEGEVSKIVINSQNRAQKFYEKLGYELVPGVDPRIIEERPDGDYSSAPRDYAPSNNKLGFFCVLLEKNVPA
nr:GNAT family N-acetyltransferase [uncultured Butyrivibrio sp.]